MSAPVSVIIPTLNEERHIGATIDAAFAAGAAEVIVSDGGSRDATLAIALERRARVIAEASMRSQQLNRGAAAAANEHFIFLHADTLLPADAAALVVRALERSIFGGFRVRFAEDNVRLRVAATMVNLRTIFTRAPWGDQAQFVRRETFERAGGYRAIAIMEDYELARRMKRFGKTVVLPQKVTTSGRRFLQKGVLRTAAINWSIIARYRLGADPDDLARRYRG